MRRWVVTRAEGVICCQGGVQKYGKKKMKKEETEIWTEQKSGKKMKNYCLCSSFAVKKQNKKIRKKKWIEEEDKSGQNKEEEEEKKKIWTEQKMNLSFHAITSLSMWLKLLSIAIFHSSVLESFFSISSFTSSCNWSLHFFATCKEIKHRFC